MPQATPDNREIIEKANRQAKAVYFGIPRKLSPEPYVCHPLRVALVLARYFARRNAQMAALPEDQRGDHVRFTGAAQEIVADYSRLRDLDVDTLCQELVKLAGQLTPRQLKIVVGALGHDAIEDTVTPASGDKHIDSVIDFQLKSFKRIYKGSNGIIWAMTNELNVKDTKQKHRYQIDWAKRQPRDLIRQWTGEVLATREDGFDAFLVKFPDNGDNRGDLHLFLELPDVRNDAVKLEKMKKKKAGKHLHYDEWANTVMKTIAASDRPNSAAFADFFEADQIISRNMAAKLQQAGVQLQP